MSVVAEPYADRPEKARFPGRLGIALLGPRTFRDWLSVLVDRDFGLGGISGEVARGVGARVARLHRHGELV